MASSDAMFVDNPCGGSDLTISNVIADLDECMKHCNADVNYIPPAYYLKQLNSKTYAS